MGGQFEGGATSAFNSLSEQTARDFTNQHLAQIIQERMLAIQIQNALQQRQAAGRAGAAQTLFGPDAAAVGAPFAAPTSPPPGGVPPQAPMPGQASVPMAAPTGAPPMGDAGGMSTIPSMPPGASPEQGAAGPENSPSPGPSEPQAAPLGWQVGATASEELGGPPPGAEAPPLPQSVGAPPQSMIPPSMTVNGLIAGLQKAPMTPEAKYAAFEELYPKVLKQEVLNHQRFLDTLQVQKAGYMAERAEADKIRAETARDVGAARIGRMVASADNARDATQIKRDALDAKLTGKAPAGAPAADATAAAGGIDPKTVDFYAQQSIAGDNSWQVGLARGRVGQALIAAVKDRIPAMSEELGLSPQEVGSNKAANVALSAALRDRTKFVAAAQQFSKNMQAQADLVDKYMEKGTAGGIPALNKWIQAGRVAIAGDPDVSALDTTLRGLAREHQRIVTGVTSNAQLHVAAQHTADELLNRAQTVPQMKAVLKVMREEADNAIAAGQQEAAGLKTQLTQLGKGSAPAGKTTLPDGTRLNFTPNATGRAAAEADIALKGQVEAAGQKYEPDKYDYKVEGGKVFRKPK